VAGGGAGGFGLAHVMGEAAAAAFAGDEHGVIAHAVQQPHRRRADLRRQHRLGAALQQDDPAVGVGLRGRSGRWRAAPAGRQGQHGGGGCQRRDARQQRRQRFGQGRQAQRGGKPALARQQPGQQGPPGAVGEGPLVTLLHIVAGVVDQLGVIDAGGAGGGAGQAGKAAVDVFDHLWRRICVGLQHFLDQIDAPARAIQLVAEQDIGGAGGGAEAAVDAFADHRLGDGGVRISQLVGGEAGLHVSRLRGAGKGGRD